MVEIQCYRNIYCLYLIGVKIKHHDWGLQRLVRVGFIPLFSIRHMVEQVYSMTWVIGNQWKYTWKYEARFYRSHILPSFSQFCPSIELLEKGETKHILLQRPCFSSCSAGDSINIFIHWVLTEGSSMIIILSLHNPTSII